MPSAILAPPMNSNRTIRNLLVAGILLLSCVLVATILVRYRGHDIPDAADLAPISADLSLSQIDYTETRDGEPVWTLQAASAAHDFSQERTQVEDIHLVFFRQNQLGDMELTAKSGEWRAQQGELDVRDDVVVRSQGGYICYADRLTYSEKDRMIRTSGPVRLVGETMELRGTGMELDVVNNRVRLLSDVWTRWQPRKEG